MGRRLNTYVHVDNVAYGPEDDVPAEVAERITALGVWADEELDEISDPAGDPAGLGAGVLVKRPSITASKAVWVDYAVAQGLDADEAEKLTRDQLAARFAD